MRKFRWLFLVLGLCALCRPAFAGRPLITEDSRTVGEGKVQLEAGYNWSQLPSGETQVSRGGILMLGIMRNLDLTMGKGDVFAVPVDGAACYGVCDSLVGLKYRFQDETASRPALGVKAFADLNDGDRIAGTGQTEYGVNFFASRRCGEGCFHGNVGYFMRDPLAGFSHQDMFNYSLAFEEPLGRRVTLVGEVVGFSSISREAQAVAQLGLTWQLSPSVILDAGYVKGLNESTVPKGNITLGVTVAF